MAHGMNANNGKRMTGIELLNQQVSKAIITPINSSILNRQFGSLTFDMIDQPGNHANLLRLYASCVEAIVRWVPTLIPTRIQPEKDSDVANGVFKIRITGITTVNVDNITAGTAINLTIPFRNAA